MEDFSEWPWEQEAVLNSRSVLGGVIKGGGRSYAKSISVLRWVNLRAITYVLLLCLLSLCYVVFYFEWVAASTLISIALGFSLKCCSTADIQWGQCWGKSATRLTKRCTEIIVQLLLCGTIKGKFQFLFPLVQAGWELHNRWTTSKQKQTVLCSVTGAPHRNVGAYFPL